MKTTPVSVRLVAVFASATITYSLLSGVYALAQPPVPDALIAQATPTVIVR